MHTHKVRQGLIDLCKVKQVLRIYQSVNKLANEAYQEESWRQAQIQNGMQHLLKLHLQVHLIRSV